MDEKNIWKAAKVALERVKPSGLRKNRTMSLDNDLFEELQEYARTNGVTPSAVIDELIRAFLELAEKS